MAIPTPPFIQRCLVTQSGTFFNIVTVDHALSIGGDVTMVADSLVI
jgi:hypothetical protein